MKLSGRAFLVGANASGKSNVLDAMRFLRDLAKPTGGLANALNELGRGGFKGLRSLHARDPSHIALEADVGTEAEPELWSYRLVLQQFKGEAQVSVEEEQVFRCGSFVEGQIRPREVKDALLYSQTLMEQVQKNGEFRELTEFLASIRYLHVVPQIVRDGRRAVAVGEDPYGGDLLRRMKETQAKSREARLKRIGEAVALAVPGFEELSLKDDAEGRPHLYARYKHWRSKSARQSEEVFSDGTLRLIGFLWSVSERGGPLLLEEPELSLNEALVAQLPKLIARSQSASGRQVICTTHSEKMLDAEGIALEEVQRIIIGRDGSVIERAADNPGISRKIREAQWTIGQTILPLLMPVGVNEIGGADVLGR